MRFLLIALVVFGVELAFAAPTYNCKITSQVDRSASGTSTKFLNSNPNRRCLVFQVHGSSTVYIKFNSAHSGTEGISVSNAFWEPVVIPTGAVYLKSSAGTVVTTVLEGE